MKITRVSETASQLCMFGLVNCWLVEDNDGLTLVDTNLGPAVTDIVAEITRRGMPLHCILLTHAHGDHVGGLDGVSQHFGSARAVTGAREAVLYNEAQRGIEKEHFTLYPDEPQTPVKGGFPACKTPLAGTLRPGEAAGSLRCVASPGHTPGHVAYLDERDGTLFAGDALLTIGETRIAGDGIWYFPLPNYATWHKPAALDSARNLAALQPEKICCGHGPAVTTGVREALAHAIRRGEKTLAEA